MPVDRGGVLVVLGGLVGGLLGGLAAIAVDLSVVPIFLLSFAGALFGAGVLVTADLMLRGA